MLSSHITNRIPLWVCVAAIIYATVTAQAIAAPPNIVLLYADDAGYADFGFQAKPDEAMKKLTPNIDSIAASGARFTNAYMSGAVCSPSRAGMLAGRYQQRFGHELNLPPGYQSGLPLSEKTFADRMKTAGYTTGIIGKWHLGYPEDFHPNKRGFDDFFGLLQGSRGYFPMKKVTRNRVIQFNGTPTPEIGYVTDRFGEGAIDFIQKHKAKPFVLYVSFTSPHGPLHAKEEDLKALAHIQNKRRRTYAAMVKSMDDNVGRILKTLKDNGLEDNTLVIFTNDNGGQTGTGAINAPLRGRKGQIWEGGVRVPMAIKWPGKIKAGLVIKEPVISLDFLPTFLAASESSVEASVLNSWKLDGQNLLPRLTGKVEKLTERPLFWRIHGPKKESSVRLGDWKLILLDHETDTKPLLYNLKNDIAEEHDLANENPEMVTKLRKLLTNWEAELTDPLWSYPPKKKKAKQKKNKKPNRRKRKPEQS